MNRRHTEARTPQRRAYDPESPRMRVLLPSVILALALAAAVTPATATPGDPPPAAAEATVEETTYQSVDATISAQWDFPARTPAPLVVLMPASASVDRNGLPPGYGEDPSTGIYAQLTRTLVQAGFAVFRFDHAGVGRSGPGQYTTDRATALEGYTRAVAHPKVDRDLVFLFGHSASTDTVVGIYPRYSAVVPPAGVVLLANIVGETDIVRAEAPTLVVVSDKTPDEVYRYGQFPADARARSTTPKLETSLVTVTGADVTLLSAVDKDGGGKLHSLDPRAVDAIVGWLKARVAARPAT